MYFNKGSTKKMGTPVYSNNGSGDDPKWTKQKHDALGSDIRGERISVCRKKGCVFLLSIGKPPFAMVPTKRGPAIVTNGYQAHTFSDHEYWLGETKLDPEWAENEPGLSLEKVTANKPLYRFTSVQNPSIQSEWQRSPTEAYRQCFELRHPDKIGTGNGQLIIGITYPNLQAKVLEAYPEASGLLSEMRSAYFPTIRRSQRKSYSSSTDAESASPAGSESRSLDGNISYENEARKKPRRLVSRPNSQTSNGSYEDQPLPPLIMSSVLPVPQEESVELPPISIDSLDAAAGHLTSSAMWTWTLVSPSSSGTFLQEEEEQESN